ncbi:unnamed protein product [Microthlaspi erraticum]|uniref:F-box domain-containing protein n=1 Tax=Microthlaspi erraticum TaxID=1685480 RepID=A0A6D2L448_9BRAS|nr:unnamed protein product [Microthlaspi erraticum]
MNSIPIDISFEIFSRLCAKSIARCRCVSKLWDSMLQRPDFKELFLTRSSFRPRLLFALGGFGERDEFLFFSSPHHQIPSEKSSPEISADFQMKLPGKMSPDMWSYASGLMYFPNMWNAKKGEDRVNVICNPSTGLCVDLPQLDLPQLRTDSHSRSFLGFDPIDKQFKVLFMAYPSRVLTLGPGKMSWREIKCSLTHSISRGRGICINGVLYYLAVRDDNRSYVIVCFDVRSEKFKFVDGKEFVWWHQLVNYKGKLGVINKHWRWDDNSIVGSTINLSMWILNDLEKQEWSEHAYTMRGGEIRFDSDVGVTVNGEIVLLSPHHYRGRFCVFFFNPETHTLQSVGFRGQHEALANPRDRTVYAFVNHEEDLEFNFMKTTYAATSVNPQLRTRFESINKFDALCLSDDD